MYQNSLKGQVPILGSATGQLPGQLLGNQGNLRLLNSQSAFPIQFLNDKRKFEKGKPGQYDRPKSNEVLVGADNNNTQQYSHRAYHHIISFHRLASFWDHMIEVARETNDVSDIQRIIVQVITMYQSQLENPRVQERDRPPREENDPSVSDGFYAPDKVTVLTIKDLFHFAESLTLKRLDSQESTPYLELIAEMYTWMPFNLVQGPHDRVLDPGEEYDEAAANIRGDAGAYLELMHLMAAYQRAQSPNDRNGIITQIERVMQQHAKDSIFIPDNPVEDFEKEDEKVGHQLIERARLIADRAKSALGTAPGKKKESREIENLDRNIKKYNAEAGSKADRENAFKAILKMLSSLNNETSAESSSLSYIERIQQLVNGARRQNGRPLFERGAVVEYGSGQGNNCFFYALQHLNFKHLTSVDDMRANMDALRQNVPGYYHGGMIETNDK